jgi:hypothetical protein
VSVVFVDILIVVTAAHEIFPFATDTFATKTGDFALVAFAFFPRAFDLSFQNVAFASGSDELRLFSFYLKDVSGVVFY